MSNKSRFYADTKSSCCRGPEMLVRSKPGGFVTRNCCVCKKKALWVTLEQLPDVDCEMCGQPMIPGNIGKNYSYRCSSCTHSFVLWDQLPWYSDEGFQHR